MQEYQAQVIAKKYLAPNVIELSVKLTKPRVITFKAGQFVFFNVGGAFKAYSITSLPADKNNLRFLIKLEENGVGSNFVKNLKIGQALEFTGPEGNFIFKSRKQDIFCLAAGIGIAPFISMVPDWLAKKYSGRLTLIYGAKSKADIFYSQIFGSLMKQYGNLNFIALTGQRVADYLEKNRQNFSAGVFYVCGKPKAVNDLQNVLEKKGCNQERIYTESFLA